MAIFVALIFQVLFVAFAMAINIGLVVHDKINLQNSVDLAAYYAAQKQAEQLNIIAHQNYMIRQSFKLLSWRYNVLGSSGRDDSPARNGGPMDERTFEDRPSICVTYNQLFRDVGRDSRSENMCKEREVRIPEIRLPGVIAGFNPINVIFQQRVISLVRQLNQTCQGYGAYNYYLAAASMGAFRRDQANRKQVIFALANNMAKPLSAMIDLDGAPVEVGVDLTFRKNLTFTNSQGVSDFKTFNSLAGVQREDWLHEIPIDLNLIYSDIIANSPGSGPTCEVQFKTADQGPNNPGGFGALLGELAGFVANPPAGDINQFSLGVEKNPWYMVYAGVSAKTKVTQIFWPFGGPIELTATAYAQPFGGRIGPWYFSNWAPGAKASSGSRVDALTPPLTGSGISTNSFDRLPNYSRYPGDLVGLRSNEAHAAVAGIVNSNAQFSDYSSIIDIGPNTPNDILAFDPDAPNGGTLREAELTAIVPDLFDITYYSIDPQFNKSYLGRLASIKSALGLPGTVPIRGDLGSRDGSGTIGINDQIKISNGDATGTPRMRREAYWPVRNREHFLVDWVHGDSFEIMENINLDRFGKCSTFDDDKLPTPGSCIAGGRTGYSVKIVSPDYLRSPELSLGGSGQNGPIANPPQDAF